MPSEAASNLIKLLTPIWQRVLRRSPIGVHDNFFDLGGDPWMAIDLFQEISKATKRDLVPLMIYAAPTVGELSALLESSASPRFPALVLLKAGTTGTPVFIIHGLGGNIMGFFQLLKHVQTPHPIYGLQTRGTDGLEEPCSCIEELAHFHVDAVKTLQPRGPYVLLGYSLGGIVALEVARRLTETGENIALLGMIDSYPSLRYAVLAQRLRVLSRRAAHYASRMLRPLPSKAILDDIRHANQTSDTLLATAAHAEVRTSLGIAFTPAMRRVEESARKALQDYEPRYYHGRIRFVRAGTPLHFPDDPEKVWAKFTDQFEVETVPGNHHELLTTHYVSLAAVISRYLSELSVGQLTGSSHR